MTIQDCYRILGVSGAADLEEIKSAFRRLAFRYHPDLNPAPDAAQRFREINEAYV
ncbi:MAG: DnaJ domain-containing protein, partial [Desulfovibrionaceae bacterium]